MASYDAEYGYPKADISVFSANVHIMPPKEGGATRDSGIPRDAHDYSLKASTILEHADAIQDPTLKARVHSLDDVDDVTQDLLRAVAEHFGHQLKQVPCNSCGALIWIDDWAGYYARNKCTDCANSCNGCGADLSETKELVRREASVRKGNKYKCTACGYSWEGIVTG